MARDHGFHPLPVRRIVRETSDAVSVVLDVPAELRDAFGYQAGQFLTFRITIAGQPLLRSYSMSSSPEADSELQVTVKRVAGGAVSNWIVDRLEPGAVIESTCPAGSFLLGNDGDGDGGDIVAFAGGSGITPIYSLLKTALTTTSRAVSLLYANRDPEAAIFAGALDSLAAQFPGRLKVVHHFDEVDGFVSADAIRRHAGDTAEPEVFICGPAPFMDLVDSTLQVGGVDSERIHIERFTPQEPPETPPTTPGEQATSVTVELDGQTQTTEHRSGTTILQTARQMGMTPPFSCEAGDCATCMAKLVEGTVQMRANNALFDDEVAEGWILTCQAVPDPPTVRVVYGYGED
jgi:ferredoxin-NADP reductase